MLTNGSGVVSVLLGVMLSVSMASVALAESKIGFVNAGQVSSEAPQAEEARANLEREFSPRDREIADEQSEIRAMEERLSRDGAAMAAEEQRNLQREVVARKRELRRVQEEFREDFNLRRNEELGRLQSRIIDTINQLAQEMDFDLILSEGVIYAGEEVDITEQVLERLRQDLASPSSPQ